MGVEAGDAGEFGKTPVGAAACENGDEVDGLGDQGAWDGDDGFLNELFETA